MPTSSNYTGRQGNAPKPVTLPHRNSVLLGGILTVQFIRTCRVPRSSRTYDLPAGLGEFPLYKVSDFQSSPHMPQDWKPEGHFIPMYAHEAMWLHFRQSSPCALMVGAGMVNAVTGERLTDTLSASPQNYMVAPPQPWLDGFKPTTGEKVYQFVAAQLGSGETAEEQILGTAEFGGIQLGLFKPVKPLIPEPSIHEDLLSGDVKAAPPMASAAADWANSGSIGSSLMYRETYNLQSFSTSHAAAMPMANFSTTAASLRTAQAMGLGAGGSISQKIYPDPYLNGRPVEEVWHTTAVDKAYIYIVSATDFKMLTGHEPPASPINYATYQSQGLPWYGLKDGSWDDVEGGTAIDNLTPVSGGPDSHDPTGGTVNPTTNNLW